MSKKALQIINFIQNPKIFIFFFIMYEQEKAAHPLSWAAEREFLTCWNTKNKSNNYLKWLLVIKK